MKILAFLTLSLCLVLQPACTTQGSGVPTTPDGISSAPLTPNQVAYGLEQGFQATLDILVKMRSQGYISQSAWTETYLPLLEQGNSLLNAYEQAISLGDLNLALVRKEEVLTVWTELNARAINLKEAYP